MEAHARLWTSYLPLLRAQNQPLLLNFLTQEPQWQGVALLAPVKPVRTILGDWPTAADWGEAKEEPATVLDRDTAQKNPRVAPTTEEWESTRGTLRGPGPSSLGPTQRAVGSQEDSLFLFLPGHFNLDQADANTQSLRHEPLQDRHGTLVKCHRTGFYPRTLAQAPAFS